MKSISTAILLVAVAQLRPSAVEALEVSLRGPAKTEQIRSLASANKASSATNATSGSHQIQSTNAMEARKGSHNASTVEVHNASTLKVTALQAKVQARKAKYVPDPIMGAIDMMRAEVCAKMYDKHDRDYGAFEECKKFMNVFCRPGKDKQMSGGKKERPSGQGHCQKFFPGKVDEKVDDAIDKSKEAVEKAGKNAEKKLKEMLGKSNYDRHPGKVLGEPIPGHETGMKVTEAEAACQKLGKKCAGFTCDADLACVVRGPGKCDASPACFTDSPGDVSFLKPASEYPDEDGKGNMGDVQNSEDSETHDGQLEIGENDGADGDGHGGGEGSTYGRHEGKTLGEALSGESELGVSEAQARCDELGDKCAGLTCDKEETSCTLRGPGNLVDCAKGSVSYVKPGSTYGRHEGKTLGAALSGESELGVSAAQARCDALGDKCAGLTCDKEETSCTVRGPGNLVDCSKGSVSYVKPGFEGGGNGDGGAYGGGTGGGDGTSYKAHRGMTLGEVISGESELQGANCRADAEARCNALGDECAGFTCDKNEEVCTLRSHGNLVPCPQGSVSYVKPGAGSVSSVDESNAGAHFHMDESKGAREQGYYGKNVQHDDGETSASDWQHEFGRHSNGKDPYAEICKNNTGAWCKHNGYGGKKDKSAAHQLRWAPLLLLLLVAR